MFKSDLRNELPALLMTWRKESRKQHEQKGLGTLLSADGHGIVFFSGVWVKYHSTGWQLEPDIEVLCVCVFFLKDTVPLYKGNFKISFNSLLGSKKHIFKQNRAKQNATYKS